jgi:hypothetical protein
MTEIIRCDGDCGKESPDAKGRYASQHWTIIIERRDNGSWYRHRLCDDCARKNVFLIRKNGEWVSNRGFASDVLR